MWLVDQAQLALDLVPAPVSAWLERRIGRSAVGRGVCECLRLDHQARRSQQVEVVYLERVEALVVTGEQLPLIQRRPLLNAQTARLGAKLAARRDEPAGEGFDVATQRFRELEMPYWVGVTQLEHAEHLLAAGRGDETEPLLAEARRIFERLRAEPWLRRARLETRERDAPTRLEA